MKFWASWNPRHDDIHCDASFHPDLKCGWIGIVHGENAWRIKIRSTSSIRSELLAIILARKLCGAGKIVSDCQSIVNILCSHRKNIVRKMTPAGKPDQILAVINEGGVTWAGRRSSLQAKLVDNLSRSKLNDIYRKALTKELGLTLIEIK